MSGIAVSASSSLGRILFGLVFLPLFLTYTHFQIKKSRQSICSIWLESRRSLYYVRRSSQTTFLYHSELVDKYHSIIPSILQLSNAISTTSKYGTYDNRIILQYNSDEQKWCFQYMDSMTATKSWCQ